MFKVEVDSLQAYFDFDPARRADLLALDALVLRTAPVLERHFHAGTPRGQPGMRFKMIGYGRTLSPRGLAWPRIGVALQKNYISAYLIDRDLLEPCRGALGEVRMGQGNFSFLRFDDLRLPRLERLLQDIAAGVC